MITPEIERSFTTVLKNTLPQEYMGRWYNKIFGMDLGIKPPFDNRKIMAGVSPLLAIIDKQTQTELFRFQTNTAFSFDGKYSKAFANEIIYQCIGIAIEEFNTELKKQNSLLIVNTEYPKPLFEEILPKIEDAYNLNSFGKNQVKAYWQKTPDYSNDNDKLIENLPEIPNIKKYSDRFTEEQQVLFRYIQTQRIDLADEKILLEAIKFYEECFPKLLEINLFTLTDKQAVELKKYLSKVFNNTLVMFNDLFIDTLYRVTVIEEKFIKDRKVRDTKWLTYPPLELNKTRGVYGRANSSERTVFYASVFENVAIRERKPVSGQRIIVSTWKNISGKPFNSFPICLATGIDNKGVELSTRAFEKISEQNHPLFAKYLEINFSFLASEFIKDAPAVSSKQYEYLYSAFFADRILSKFIDGDPTPNYDCLIYPSVAWNHIHDNLAIMPDTVNEKLRIIRLKEYEVVETYYEKVLSEFEYPAKLKVIRESRVINAGGITWDDD